VIIKTDGLLNCVQFPKRSGFESFLESRTMDMVQKPISLIILVYRFSVDKIVLLLRG
jgi:hypothetical protein